MKFKMLLLSAVVLLCTALPQAQNCNSLIIDKAGIIQNAGMIAQAARTLINQGAAVHVVTVPSLAQYGTLAGVESSFESQCPSWTNATGKRKENLFLVMVAPNDRAKNIFLGSYYSGAFDTTRTYSDLSNGYFKSRQWDAGLAAVLQGTTGPALAYRQRVLARQQNQRLNPVPPQTRTYTATAPVFVAPTQQPNTGMSGLAIFFIVVLALVVILIVTFFVLRHTDSDSTTSTTYPDSSYVPPPASGSTYPRRYAASAPSHTTTVINNPSSGGDFVTGMIVGEALSRPNYVPAPTYIAPSPIYDPLPSYTPPEPVQDAPDSSWEEDSTPQQQSEPDTDFSSDNSSSSDSSSNDSSF